MRFYLIYYLVDITMHESTITQNARKHCVSHNAT